MRWTLALAIVLAGCTPDLGTCDIQAARSPIYYDDQGYPGYPGQALVETSCGNRSFCHSSGIDPVDRYGAPAGLDFDVGVAVDVEAHPGRSIACATRAAPPGTCAARSTSRCSRDRCRPPRRPAMPSTTRPRAIARTAALRWSAGCQPSTPPRGTRCCATGSPVEHR